MIFPDQQGGNRCWNVYSYFLLDNEDSGEESKTIRWEGDECEINHFWRILIWC